MHLIIDKMFPLPNVIKIVIVLIIGSMFSCFSDKMQDDCTHKEALVELCYYNYCVDSVLFMKCTSYFKWGILQKSGRLYLLIDTYINYHELRNILTFREDRLDTIFYGTRYFIKYDTANLPIHIKVLNNSDTVEYLDYPGVSELIVMNLSTALGALWFKRLLNLDSIELKFAIKTTLNIKNYNDSIILIYIIPKDYFSYFPADTTQSSYEEICGMNKTKKFVFSIRVRRSNSGYNLERYYIYPATYVTELPCF